MGVLPQNPQALFVKKTVREDLFETFEDCICLWRSSSGGWSKW